MANASIEQNPAAVEPERFNWGTYLPALIVAGLGFLVDVYDVLLFAVLRVPSLKNLGVAADATLNLGVQLMNCQMVGLLLGGIVWGIVGDKKGRRAALFGSILIYSVANLANAFITTVPEYAVCRFIAGFGLAGEVGAAMTIVSEITPAKYRTLGTAAVSVMGVFGSLLASWVGETLPWRMAFQIAGVAGLGLLFVRFSMKESPLFEKTHSSTNVDRSVVKLILQSPKRLLRMTRCVLSALPLFFVFGVLVAFSPEIHSGSDKVATSVANVAIFYSIGETLGEVASGVLSQLAKSRKKVIIGFQLCALITTAFVLRSTADNYAMLCLPLGFFVGYWALVITTTSEQFGTNVRSTVTTVVPNIMRACHIPLNLLFAMLTGIYGTMPAIISLAAGSFILAFISVLPMEETFAKDLDFVEA